MTERVADRLAIQDLNADFAYFLDHDEVAPLADLFTEDAVYSNGPRLSEGRAAMPGGQVAVGDRPAGVGEHLPGDGVADSTRLRAFNEAQNRIAAQLVRLLTADQNRYPDDVFASVLVDQLQMVGVDPERIFAGCLDLAPEPETGVVPAQP